MRKRRKTRYTWLPVAATPNAEDQWLIQSTGGFDIAAGATSDVSAGAVQAVLNDIPQADDTTGLQVSMADAVGSEYFLKRLVGKVFVVINGVASANGFRFDAGTTTDWTPGKQPTLLVTAGFYIAPEEHPAGSSVPMGFAADSDRYNPQVLDASREPWIWRRSWLLSPFSLATSADAVHRTRLTAGTDFTDSWTAAAGFQVGIGTHPTRNDAYGSVLDGPHLDAKTARRVRQHERLWFTCFGHTVPVGTQIDADIWDKVTVGYTLDVRALGALRKARNRSSFE